MDAPGPAAAPSPPEPQSPFHPAIIHAHSQLRYFQLGKVGLAISGDFYSVPIRVDAQGARIDRSFYTGLKGHDDGAFLVMSVSGDWPKRGDLALNLPGERGGTDIDYEWNGSSWAQARRQIQGDMPPDVNAAYYLGGYGGSFPWGERTLYYILTSGGGDGPLLPRFVLGGKGKSKPAPVVTKGQGACPTRLVGYLDLRALRSGDLLGVGKLCTRPEDYGWMSQPGPGALAVERWPSGATRRERALRGLPHRHRRGVARFAAPAGAQRSGLPARAGDRAAPVLPRLPRARGRPGQRPAARSRRAGCRLRDVPRHHRRRARGAGDRSRGLA